MNLDSHMSYLSERIKVPNLVFDTSVLRKPDSIKCDVFDSAGTWWKMYMTVAEIEEARRKGFTVTIDPKDPLQDHASWIGYSYMTSSTAFQEDGPFSGSNVWTGMYLAQVMGMNDSGKKKKE